MKRRTLHLNVFRDEGGQALTEFVIVIPIVLLFFFAMLQYFVIVRASQLANYAAFCAARVYAVQAAVDSSPKKDQANAKALTAAALAMAPVAQFVPGEIAGLNLRISRSSPQIDEQLLALGEGWLVARYVRFNPKFGGSVKIETGGNPLQVNVEINYPQPIYIPGLSELWGMVGGRESKIERDLRPLSDKLGGIVGASYNAQKWVEAKFDEIDDDVPFLFKKIPGYSATIERVKSYLSVFAGDIVYGIINQLLPFPYINVQAKCAMGYEDWGRNPKDRPRKRSTGEEDKADPVLQQQLDNMKNAQKELEVVGKELTPKAEDLKEAKAKVEAQQKVVDAAQQAYDSATTPEKKTAAQTKLNSEKQKLNQLKASESKSEAALREAQNKYDAAREKIEASFPPSGYSYDGAQKEVETSFSTSGSSTNPNRQ